MSELIYSSSGDLGRYEEVLLQRDMLEKEAMDLQLAYTREFGELNVAVYREKVACIAVKQSIAFCQAAVNRGKTPDTDALDAYLTEHLAAYRAALDKMVNEWDLSRSGKPISAYEAEKVKKLYRQIARKLHPDLNPAAGRSEELKALFVKVMTAYRFYDLKGLQELEVLTDLALERLGLGDEVPEIEDLASRIGEIESEIEEIITTEPYTYRELLADAVTVEEKKKELRRELEETKAYRAELQAHLDELLG